MGYWNVGIFDNDVALDFIEDLVEQNDSNLITDILYSVYTIAKNSPNELIDEDYSSEALVAAEVVATMLGSSKSDIPEELMDWITEINPMDIRLKGIAEFVVMAIRDHSELRELWDESESLNDWLSTIEGLLLKLK